MKLGTPARMLARSNDPSTSHSAAASIDTTKLEGMVLSAYLNAGSHGMTQDELLRLFPGYSYSSITARPSALKRKNLVAVTGDKRRGDSGRPQAVLVAVQYEGVLW